MIVKSIKSALIFTTLALSTLACSSALENAVDRSGETVILNGDLSCTGTACTADDELEPNIDTAELPSIEDQEALDEENGEDPNADLSDDEVATPEPEIICDDLTDTDGDGLSCLCDNNDDSARDTNVNPDCDSDTDGIADEYDACPNKSDADKVTVVKLCDDAESIPTGITVEVAYDAERWTQDSCPKILLGSKNKSQKVASTLVTNLAGVSPLRTSANFPVAYIFEDKNENGKPDNCAIMLDIDSVQINPIKDRAF